MIEKLQQRFTKRLHGYKNLTYRDHLTSLLSQVYNSGDCIWILFIVIKLFLDL